MNPIALIAKALGIDTLLVKLGLAVLLAIGLGVASCSIKKSIITKHDALITAKTMKIDDVAKENAATERAADTSATYKAEKERNDAINKAHDSKPSAARNALNCERLRRKGANTDSFSSCR